MNNFSTKVKIEKIFEETSHSNDFKKRAFIGTAQETKGDKTYDHKFHFELLGDKTSLLNNVSEGQEVTVHFNIKTNEWTKENVTNYFTSLNVWKIE